MSEHTPKPWEYREAHDGIWAKIKHPHGNGIAEIFCIPRKPQIDHLAIKNGEIYIQVAYSAWYQFEVGGFNKEAWKANGLLIAAAPDLLEALRDAEDALKGMIYNFEHETGENVDASINLTMEKIEQAIAKVKPKGD